MRHASAMTILKYFLQLLEVMGQISEFLELLSTPIGLAGMVCLTSYESLILFGCDTANSIVLAAVVTLTFHIASNRPNF
ncbi:hypothetical protein Lepto7376_2924 [[Leptolyngbya] sp. PCC 7376]|uniref:hypothetical protein n=1 Tax=[Leptolyngbya] sp. PCC 7376 TaxID=111781 RepID=UPI00029F050B|nr:hypothetical protein [[Leptolyngbya] sp. PCC 7376]AFY39176.1 hypothetical protein Lepto7376_2924 [[Leptolyngbya] sp. PCC 7376]